MDMCSTWYGGTVWHTGLIALSSPFKGAMRLAPFPGADWYRKGLLFNNQIWKPWAYNISV